MRLQGSFKVPTTPEERIASTLKPQDLQRHNCHKGETGAEARQNQWNISQEAIMVAVLHLNVLGHRNRPIRQSLDWGNNTAVLGADEPIERPGHGVDKREPPEPGWHLLQVHTKQSANMAGASAN